MKRVFAAIASTGIFFATAAEAEEKEPIAIFEIGSALNWTTPNTTSAGPTIAVEFTPIENWLEIEIGTGPLFASGATDWSTDILFKKPFTLSNTAELMVGAGPAFDTTFGGTTCHSACNCGSDAILVQLVHSAPISLACSRSILPRPYICRLTSLRRVI